MIGLAVLAMAAAPPATVQHAPPSGWNRFVAGAKGFFRNPLGTRRSTPNMPAPDDTVVPELTLPPEHGTPQVPTTPRRPVRRASWIDFLKRQRRASRTVSEYMAEEKP
ncbi:MAG: hypothetical protein DWQ37_21710 [Planctomycetota bacterium]|nr:MAG: hypothetical protein DWQ37_21710 [Planctomycetota bacterium]